MKSDSTTPKPTLKGLQAFFIRYFSKLRARELMKDRVRAAKLPPPQTLSEVIDKYSKKVATEDELWQIIYDKSMQSNVGVDSRFQYGDAGIPFYDPEDQ